MKKQRLDIDALEVESFSTLPDTLTRGGTVFGHASEDAAISCAGTTCDYNACTAAQHSCDMRCTTGPTHCIADTCELCGTGGGGGGNSMHTACLNCFTNADGCTNLTGCQAPTQICH